MYIHSISNKTEQDRITGSSIIACMLQTYTTQATVCYVHRCIQYKRHFIIVHCQTYIQSPEDKSWGFTWHIHKFTFLEYWEENLESESETLPWPLLHGLSVLSVSAETVVFPQLSAFSSRLSVSADVTVRLSKLWPLPPRKLQTGTTPVIDAFPMCVFE